MSESIDTRTLGMIGQVTKHPDLVSEWSKIAGRAAIIYSNSSLDKDNSRLALAMSINCLSRTNPIITNLDIAVADESYDLAAPLFEGQSIRECIASFTKKLRPDVKIRTLNHLEGDYDAILSIGTTSYKHPFKITISSNGWLTRVSPTTITSEFTKNVNPIGAYFAANLGCVEVFKKIFVKKADLIIPQKSDYDFRWRTKFLQNELIVNTFDYSLNKTDSANPHLPKIVDVGELLVAGVGAGGGASLYTLASLPSIQGVMHLVDPDEIKGSNLNRYVYATRLDADKNTPKTDVMKKIFSNHTKCVVHSQHIPYSQYNGQLNGKPIDLLISTVDTDRTRIDIQWDLPRIILDAAVFSTWFYIDRVEFGNNACLGCRFYKDSSSESEESRLSKIIGLSPDIIVNLRANNALFEQSHIDIMKQFSEKNGFTLPKVGEHFQDWFIYHCSELHLDSEEIIIPLPFATIMPGILLAGEVIKQRYFNKQNRTQHYFSYDTFSISKDNIDELKRNEKCQICSDQTTLNRYKEKHNILKEEKFYH
ncbi:MAG: ThiF family adenylyltransferase [Candidatus Nitrosotenuis sp.]